jgi:hypothetical protein
MVGSMEQSWPNGGVSGHSFGLLGEAAVLGERLLGGGVNRGTGTGGIVAGFRKPKSGEKVKRGMGVRGIGLTGAATEGEFALGEDGLKKSSQVTVLQLHSLFLQEQLVSKGKGEGNESQARGPP